MTQMADVGCLDHKWQLSRCATTHVSDLLIRVIKNIYKYTHIHRVVLTLA